VARVTGAWKKEAAHGPGGAAIVACDAIRLIFGDAPGVFEFGSDLVLLRLAFVLPGADLLRDFFGDAVNRRIQIAFDILGEQIRPAHAQADGATELFFGDAGVIVFEGHARIHGAPVKMVELHQAGEDVVFNGLGQRYVVRRKYQFHITKMQPMVGKIQFFLGLEVVKRKSCQIFIVSGPNLN
jgi:hypothetical protein